MRNKRAQQVALSGLLTSLMLVFGLIERQFPLTAAIPGVKLGLANSVLLYSLYMLGIRQSFVLMLLKALMSWLIYTNMNAMFYSLGGGLLSLVVMILVSRMKGVSVIGVSALGAVFFNVGQILVAVLMLNTPQLLVTYLPILMISAKQLPEDKHKGFLVGTDDYMTKPLDEEELLLRIRALLRRAKIASERKIVIGDVTLDYDSLTVSRAGQTQELPQKEFQLLYKLLSYPGKIFTRIQLMDEIWGLSSETGWETVTVHIGRLRKRFEGWEEFEIESVRGLGYKAVKKV